MLGERNTFGESSQMGHMSVLSLLINVFKISHVFCHERLKGHSRNYGGPQASSSALFPSATVSRGDFCEFNKPQQFEGVCRPVDQICLLSSTRVSITACLEPLPKGSSSGSQIVYDTPNCPLNLPLAQLSPISVTGIRVRPAGQADNLRAALGSSVSSATATKAAVKSLLFAPPRLSRNLLLSPSPR